MLIVDLQYDHIDSAVLSERMPYPSIELNSNSNAPDEDPGIFIKTKVNE